MAYVCNVEDHGEDVTEKVNEGKVPSPIGPLRTNSRLVTVYCSKGHRLVFMVGDNP